ncbi:MAG: hypothetical protein AAGU10_05575 [Methanosarcina mazei]|jgi:hypothetical protein|nr:hypothetical protein [Methanosarcina mazei]WIM44607.1 hypothetical protein PSF70_07395 [Methanosarcina mazei]WIM48068.1 hypothetical protein PQQ20_07360 [Methanosarcina mazei]
MKTLIIYRLFTELFNHEIGKRGWVLIAKEAKKTEKTLEVLD